MTMNILEKLETEIKRAALKSATTDVDRVFQSLVDLFECKTSMHNPLGFFASASDLRLEFDEMRMKTIQKLSEARIEEITNACIEKLVSPSITSADCVTPKRFPKSVQGFGY